jgi:hypothetical protein
MIVLQVETPAHSVENCRARCASGCSTTIAGRVRQLELYGFHERCLRRTSVSVRSTSSNRAAFVAAAVGPNGGGPANSAGPHLDAKLSFWRSILLEPHAQPPDPLIPGSAIRMAAEDVAKPIDDGLARLSASPVQPVGRVMKMRTISGSVSETIATRRGPTDRPLQPMAEQLMPVAGPLSWIASRERAWEANGGPDRLL